jgi:hypothetical protein
MTAMLQAEGLRINRKRVQALMRKMRIAALGRSRGRLRRSPVSAFSSWFAPPIMTKQSTCNYSRGRKSGVDFTRWLGVQGWLPESPGFSPRLRPVQH